MGQRDHDLAVVHLCPGPCLSRSSECPVGRAAFGYTMGRTNGFERGVPP